MPSLTDIPRLQRELSSLNDQVKRKAGELEQKNKELADLQKKSADKQNELSQALSDGARQAEMMKNA